MNTDNKCKFCNGSLGKSLNSANKHYFTDKCIKGRIRLTANLLGIDLDNCEPGELQHVLSAFEFADKKMLTTVL